MKFSTKAQTLDALHKVLVSARVAPLCFFKVDRWLKEAEGCKREISSYLGPPPWIVRSSSSQEDGCLASNAGVFKSVTGVDELGLVAAVGDVIKSYGSTLNPVADEVLVQPVLKNVVCSGVAFSHDPNTCSPYRVINWSEGSDTSAITGGMSGRSWQQAASYQGDVPAVIAPVLVLIQELLRLFEGQPVDCEFAVTRDASEDCLWLLQARPLLLTRPIETESDQAHRLKTIEKLIVSGMQPHPFLVGNRSIYGVMPDWNPAEIIGVRPKPLALSLYRELITDSIWAYQRHNYGYRNLRSFPLMLQFYGMPYIDVRLSFCSFVPADLPDSLAGRLVDYYLDRLQEAPALHDKIEFEIVFSSYTFDLLARLRCLKEYGFSGSDIDIIARSLRKLTNRMLRRDAPVWHVDSKKMEVLEARRRELLGAPVDLIDKIYWLLEDTKRYGTLPFAGLARAGFVAVHILKSLVSVNIFSVEDQESFLRSIQTVSGQLSRDRLALEKTIFLERYGHLRPGTYELTTPRYDEDPDLYFDWKKVGKSLSEPKQFSLAFSQMKALQSLLLESGLAADPIALLDFIQSSIELRELSKFKFTKNISDLLILIAQYGQRYGYSREEMAYSDVKVIKSLHASTSCPSYVLGRSIDEGKRNYADTLRTTLPPLIVRPSDVWAFEWPEVLPNFVTQLEVVASVTDASSHSALAGSIVCIPRADPGYDWLFSCSIAGLITEWGGVNSHMAIRAGELGLPAVIGAGERLYKAWSAASRLRLDCAGRRVEILQ